MSRPYPDYANSYAPYRTEHVELPATRVPTEFASHYAPYQAEHEAFDFDAHDSKKQPLDFSLSSRPAYPPYHKDGSYVSDISEHTAVDFAPPPPLPPQPLPSTEPESGGFWLKLLPNSMACRLYLLTVLIETVVDIAIEVDLLVLINQNMPKTKDDSAQLEFERLPVYLVVFGLAHLFQLVLALDAVHAQNTLQFLFLAGFNVLLLAYAIVQRTEIFEAGVSKDTAGFSNIPVGALTTIIAVVIGLCEFAYIGLGWKIYTEFGWKVYKLLGADRSVKRMFMHLQVFLCLVKFDLFFFIGFTVQWIFLVLSQSDPDAEYYFTIIALPFSVVVLIAGHVAAHRELKWLMGTFILGLATAAVYFIYKFYSVFKFKNDPTFAPVFKSLTIFSALATILLFITFAWACIVMHNFGRGLKARVSKHKKGQASIALSSRTGRTGRTTNFNANHRLSID